MLFRSDRVVYASTFGHLAMLESNQAEARDAVNGFCAAHLKLEEAAAAGNLSKDATHSAVVDAIRSARGASAAAPKEPAKPHKK